MRPLPRLRPLTTALLLVAAVGCGGEASDGNASAAGVGASAGNAAAAPAAAGEPAAAAAPATAPAAPAAATVMVTRPAPKLTSLPSTPVPAGDLRDAYHHWNGATVTVAGYPDTFRDTEPWSRVSELTGTPEDDDPVLVDCDFASPPEGDAARAELAVVRGTFTGRSWATIGNVPVIQMKDCTVVPGGAAATGDPWTLDGTPVPIQQLYDAVVGWQGKKVQVVGAYDSSTHSSAGDTQRHDLRDAAGKVAVGCEHPGKAPAPRSAVDQREGVIVEGTIGEPAFGTVTLQDCRFVNRT